MPQLAYTEHTIHIHPQAPAKVPVGAACNGCGVCCLFEPCPLGAILSRARTGACVAVRWHDQRGQYRCGTIAEPGNVLAVTLPRYAQWLRPLLSALLRQWGRRWIAAGIGCDSTLEVQPPGSTTMRLTDSPHSMRAVARRRQP